MFFPLKPWLLRAAEQEIWIYPYGVADTAEGPQLFSQGINPYKDLEKAALPNCILVASRNHILLSTGRVETSFSMLIELTRRIRAKLHQDSSAYRVVITQIDDPEKDWDAICLQHRLVSQIPDLAHLSLPTNRFDPVPVQRARIINPATQPSNLARLQNLEAWLLYCAWVNEQVVFALKGFLPDALDEYQLEARMKDLGIEVNSPFLSMVKTNLKAIFSSLASVEEKLQTNPYDQALLNELLSYEKQLVHWRYELKNALESHYRAIKEIEEGIDLVLETRTKLLRLRENIGMLRLLLEDQLQIYGSNTLSWGKRLLLIQLLNDRLGAYSLINCLDGLHPANFVFAIRLALIQLSRWVPARSLLDLALHWDEIAEDAWHYTAEEGFKGVQHYTGSLVHLQKTGELSRFLLFFQFQETILENLKQVGAVLNRTNPDLHLLQLSPGPRATPEMLAFLPAFLPKSDSFGDPTPVKLIEYGATGIPLGFTEEGCAFYIQLL